MGLNNAKKPGLILSVLELMLVLILLTVAVIGFGTKIPFLAERGFNFFAVTSGSMEPEIPTGSMIKAGEYKLDELEKGDVITYRVTAAEANNAGKAVVITHRIDEVEKFEETRLIGEEGSEIEKQVVSYEFTTKGDANQGVDSHKVTAGEVIGLYEWNIPYLGHVTTFAQTSTGFLLLIVLPAILLIVWEMVSVVVHFRGKSTNKTKNELESLKKELAVEKKRNEEK